MLRVAIDELPQPSPQEIACYMSKALALDVIVPRLVIDVPLELFTFIPWSVILVILPLMINV